MGRMITDIKKLIFEKRKEERNANFDDNRKIKTISNKVRGRPPKKDINTENLEETIEEQIWFR
jgi:hypothetical protein